ncbi:vanillate O-demethylase ferredoxin subunit [Oryzisolibacter propanilivorax]|uniref:Vanillate O-demethylase ferredoxin subunit n=1 Tax=Oryzisolibacter propanilivorax TaxID=1527607 RepID=A0A1G9RQT0_9BURK|nr:PDR/VanB family oxidoreductase [Oryzisolibacter propanilivorax]SDM24805.1 vanillate O-demethylase ferredoxin subunit [Oryzisolibacter propanilivorax]
MHVIVNQISRIAQDINALELVHPAGIDLPAFQAGAHIDIHLPDGYIRQYSLCNNPDERHRYQIAVLHERTGRGGSTRIHEKIQEGDTVEISEPRNHFILDEGADRYLLIAGGIGITPIKAMAERLHSIGANYTMYYCAQRPERAAFREKLSSGHFRDRVVFHYDEGSRENQLDLQSILKQHQPGTQLYFCGPHGLIKAINENAQHWPKGTVHYELFGAPTVSQGMTGAASVAAGSFSVQISSTGQIVEIPAHQSIVESLRSAGVECETSCEAGVCGTCQTRYLSGEVDHQDLILSEADRQDQILICCSRAKPGSMLVLDI